MPVQKGWEFLLPKDHVLRGAGYIRRSDPRKEANFSLGMQKDKIIEYCQTHGIVISDEYIFSDRYTGMEWRERKGLQQALEACHRKEVDVVIAYRLDRLARDYIDQIVVREQIKSYGQNIVTLDPKE